MGQGASLEGMFVCAEGAATAVALNEPPLPGDLSPDDPDVSGPNTGSVLKYVEVVLCVGLPEP